MATRAQAKRCDEARGEVNTGTRGGAPTTTNAVQCAAPVVLC